MRERRGRTRSRSSHQATIAWGTSSRFNCVVRDFSAKGARLELSMPVNVPDAFELIAEAVAAMESEATVETIMHTIHPHPTLSEMMGEGFNAVYGLAINA